MQFITQIIPRPGAEVGHPPQKNAKTKKSKGSPVEIFKGIFF